MTTNRRRLREGDTQFPGPLELKVGDTVTLTQDGQPNDWTVVATGTTQDGRQYIDIEIA